MFTGLIEDVGTLKERTSDGKAGRLKVATQLPLDEIRTGDSVAVNGACLTVEAIHVSDRVLVFHTLAETLSRTNLGMIPPGSPVNLERALQAGGRLGGHFVLGHVDTTAAVRHIGKTADDIVLTIDLPADLQALVIPKGSIAVDGISLTVADLGAKTFSIHLIPHTWKQTNLPALKVGDPVNLEADMIGKYVLRYQHLASAKEISMGTLQNAGFLD